MIRDSRVLAGCCLCICFGLLLVGLWPLNFFPENEAWWLKDRNGLHFHGHDIGPWYSKGGVAYSSQPLFSPKQALPEKNAISIEIWMRPAIEPTRGRARIASFVNNLNNEPLFICQRKDHLLVYFPELVRPGEKKYQEIGVGKALIASKTRFVTITSGKIGTSIYLDGKPAKRFPDVQLIAENESVMGKTILLGNSPDITNSWSGDLFGLSLYNRQLTDKEVFQNFQYRTNKTFFFQPPQNGVVARYAFSERSGTLAHSSVGSANSLLIPARLQFKKKILIPPNISHPIKKSFIKDVIINIIGFIPLGFFISLWLIKVRNWSRLHTYAVAIALGLFVSLTIEVLQIYLPARDSSQTDLMCNTFGTIMGVIALHHLLRGNKCCEKLSLRRQS